MKKYPFISQIFILWMLTLLVGACQKEEISDLQKDQVISQDILDKISHLGFGTEGVRMFENNYVVEGDILLSREELNSVPEGHRVPHAEQYHTFNLVRSPRTITVRILESLGPDFSQATDIAIARYNAENLELRFRRTNRQSADIVITPVAGTGLFAYAGFPSRNGKPYGSIRISSAWLAVSADVNMLATLVAHEIGHCIGFRHTDWFNRVCSGGNEGEGSIGAVHIPGTSKAPDIDQNSWMISCFTSIGPAGNRPFTSDDKKALDYLY